MTRQIDAARDRVALYETPPEESDEYDAFTSGDARRRIPTVRPRGATAGRTTSTHPFRPITDERTADGETPKQAMIP